jgi:hypothetical protein
VLSRFKPQLLVATNGFGDSGVAVQEITVPAVKDAIRQGLKLAEDPASADKNLETIKKRASEELVKKIALTFYD